MKRTPIGERLARRLVQTPTGCMEWRGEMARNGYGRIRPENSDKRYVYTHRAAWEVANGPIPGNLYVLHKCDNRPCCNPEHLFLGTTQDNTRDRQAKGRTLRGEMSPSAKLTTAQVVEIRDSSAGGESQKKLAARFGVSAGAIQRIVERKNWRHVP